MNDNFIIPITVSYDRVSDLLCSAFEGGSNHWIGEISVSEFPPEADFQYSQDVPLRGGELKIKVYDGDEFVFNLKTIEKGLNVFFNLKEGEGGHHAPNFMKCQDDAETGDVFLQCCLFGEIMFV